MDSAESKHSNREQNATENDDVASVAGESSPRRDAVVKQGGSGSEDSVGCGINARVLNEDDFQKNDQDSDQDLLSDARDSELKLEVDDPLLKSIHNLKLSQDALQQGFFFFFLFFVQSFFILLFVTLAFNNLYNVKID